MKRKALENHVFNNYINLTKLFQGDFMSSPFVDSIKTLFDWDPDGAEFLRESEGDQSTYIDDTIQSLSDNEPRSSGRPFKGKCKKKTGKENHTPHRRSIFRIIRKFYSKFNKSHQLIFDFFDKIQNCDEKEIIKEILNSFERTNN